MEATTRLQKSSRGGKTFPGVVRNDRAIEFEFDLAGIASERLLFLDRNPAGHVSSEAT
jgi:hypothetical protein